MIVEATGGSIDEGLYHRAIIFHKVYNPMKPHQSAKRSHGQADHPDRNLQGFMERLLYKIGLSLSEAFIKRGFYKIELRAAIIHG